MTRVELPTQLEKCELCLFDSSIPSMKLDDKGICNYCKSHLRLLAKYPDRGPANHTLLSLVSEIKQKGIGKEYDCIVGVSGGTDSSYVLHMAKSLGLKPLAVHFDNGWNTDQAVSNIRRITSKLNIDLYTHVVEWEEFKDLQVAFLKASVPCIEAPTDVGIHGTLLKTAKDFKIKYILGGQSFITEGTVPPEWSYLDGTYIQSIHKKFGHLKIHTFPNLTLWKIFSYTFLQSIRQIPILNYLQYDKVSAKAQLKELYGWEDYGGHHYENIYSKFAFGWYQFKKFKIDKRKVTLSGQIRSGLISKESALVQLKESPQISAETVDYCISKLGLSQTEFNNIMSAPKKYYYDYFTSASILKFFKIPMKIAIYFGYFTPVLYEKYFETRIGNPKLTEGTQ